MMELMSTLDEMLKIFHDSNIIIYTIFYVFVCFILSSYTIKYLFLIINKFTPQELTKFLGFLTSSIYLANTEPKLFIVSLTFVPFSFTKELNNLIGDKTMKTELKRYRDRRTKINGRQDYDFFDILFIYNMISLIDYEKLYDEHFDKTDIEKVDHLKSATILDDDKKLVATYLLNYYRKNNSLLKIDELKIEDIKERIKEERKV